MDTKPAPFSRTKECESPAMKSYAHRRGRSLPICLSRFTSLNLRELKNEELRIGKRGMVNREPGRESRQR